MDPHDRHAADHLGTLQPYVIRACTGDTCGVRFPVAEANVAYAVCHLCEAPTVVVDQVTRHAQPQAGPPGREVIALFDNVRSAMNVGTMLRTCDAAGIRRAYLGGISPAGDNPKVIKAALGAEATVEWSHHPDLTVVARSLKDAGHRLWALESTPASVSLDGLLDGPLGEVDASPIVLIAGNEIAGVDPGLLLLCDLHVHLPMRGEKTSLNVAVAFGMAVHQLTRSA